MTTPTGSPTSGGQPLNPAEQNALQNPPRDALDMLRSDFPGWDIRHHTTASGGHQWVAHRRGERTDREVAAGVKRYVEETDAADLYALLGEQADRVHSSSVIFNWHGPRWGET